MIDKDHINEESEYSRTHWGQRFIEAKETLESFNKVIGRSISMTTCASPTEIDKNIRIHWRAYDDDGILYYEGHCTVEALMGEDNWAYGIVQFVGTDTGATCVVFDSIDIKRCGFSEFVSTHPKTNFDWLEDNKWIELYS